MIRKNANIPPIINVSIAKSNKFSNPVHKDKEDINLKSPPPQIRKYQRKPVIKNVIENASSEDNVFIGYPNKDTTIKEIIKNIDISFGMVKLVISNHKTEKQANMAVKAKKYITNI